MKDEIKEIDITKDLYLCSPLLNTKCPKTSCYINNGSCCYTVNKEYSQEHLLDHITNLQEEKDDYKHKFWEEQELNEYLQDRIDKATKELEKLLPLCIMPNNTLIHGTEKAKVIEKAINILQGKSDE